MSKFCKLSCNSILRETQRIKFNSIEYTSIVLLPCTHYFFSGQRLLLILLFVLWCMSEHQFVVAKSTIELRKTGKRPKSKSKQGEGVSCSGLYKYSSITYTVLFPYPENQVAYSVEQQLKKDFSKSPCPYFFNCNTSCGANRKHRMLSRTLRQSVSFTIDAYSTMTSVKILDKRFRYVIKEALGCATCQVLPGPLQPINLKPISNPTTPMPKPVKPKKAPTNPRTKPVTPKAVPKASVTKPVKPKPAPATPMTMPVKPKPTPTAPLLKPVKPRPPPGSPIDN